jgi:hypothetical protein
MAEANEIRAALICQVEKLTGGKRFSAFERRARVYSLWSGEAGIELVEAKYVGGGKVRTKFELPADRLARVAELVCAP